MKRWLLAVAVLVLALVGSAAVGLCWARSSPRSAMARLVALGLDSQQAAHWVGLSPTSANDSQARALIAHGTIEGDQMAIVSEVAGRTVSVETAEGDAVAAGQILVQLDASQLQAQVAQAEAMIAAARTDLENTRAGVHPALILGAKAELRQAEAVRDAALTGWMTAQALLQNPQEIDLRITEAQTKVDLTVPAIEQAAAQIKAAEIQRDRYRARGSTDEKWLYLVHDYEVQAAEAALAAARAEQEGAEQALAALKAVRNDSKTLLGETHRAEGQFRIAEAGVAVARATLAELEAGPLAEDLRLAEARLHKAEATLHVLQAQLDKLTLRSPTSGVVTSLAVHAGEAVVPGATLVKVADLDTVTLTVYVPEPELGRVYLGQPASIEVDAYSGQVFTGTVSFIARQAEFTPKNVQTDEERVNMVFSVRVRLLNQRHLLKLGMPADAILQTD